MRLVSAVRIEYIASYEQKQCKTRSGEVFAKLSHSEFSVIISMNQD
jgi:hypothetical protein